MALLTSLGFASLLAGCAAAPPRGHYELHRLTWEGVDSMSSEAVQACLAGQPRDAVTLRLGLGEPSCGEPPFDEDSPSVDLFTWPWEDRPVFDPAIFQVDRKRIERWYQARGFYQAEVVAVEHSVDGRPIAQPERCTTDNCELDVKIIVEEGLPVLVTEVEVSFESRLPEPLEQDVYEAVALEKDERFDEAKYQADEARIENLLSEASYARAEVETDILIDRVARTARVHYRVNAGPPVRIGNVRVEGEGELSGSMVIDVAQLETGDVYRTSELRDAERAVLALGTFASANVEESYERAPDVADLVIRVRPGRLERFRIGIGVMSGSMQRATSDELESIPQWDIHLRAGYEHRNFLGGMRKLRIEDRPRLIFLAPFPETPGAFPKLGNNLMLELEQPRFIEHRTTLFSTSAWDFGPDAFLGYFRHDLATRLGLRRSFFAGKLGVELALQHDLYEITSTPEPDNASSYRLPFVEQRVTVDLRDDAHRPMRGAYFSTSLQEAVRLGYGSWNYFRWLGEARAYQRLLWKIVLAGRFRLGAIFVGSRSGDLDPTSSELGPQSYRLRGGGANGNRGFGAGELGAGIEGGKRRWEASVELRVPLGSDVGFTLFMDAGDVGRGERVRIDRPHTSAGFGLRYFTDFAPIRFDAGWRIPGWQLLDGQEDDTELEPWPSAAHLTIGEAF